MSAQTSIEWTEATWNPVRGCRKVSPGCDHCYAETFAARFRGVPGHPYEAGFDPRFVDEQLGVPLSWKKPRTIFVNSMSDLFQGAFTDEQIAAVFGVMGATRRHTYQVLTKRSERLRKWHRWVDTRPGGAPAACNTAAVWALTHEETFPEALAGYRHTWPLRNVWQGVSVESRAYLSRIDDLRSVPAAVRFLSIEPLLEDLGTLELGGIDWVIVGGESGPGARTMDPAWVRSIRDQCADQGVAFFFKQWGGLFKKKRGRELDGRTHDALPMVVHP